ncbi:MAG: dUTPase [Bacilli bacterium]|nr:dUTPase [Bacilli bacterium]
MNFKEVSYQLKKYPNKPTLLPARSTERSAGYDFRLKETLTIEPQSAAFQWTDVKCQLSRDEVLLMFVRSSIGKKHLMLTNGTGVIDADYYNNATNDGNIGIGLYNYGTEPVTIEAGERVCQGVVVQFKTAETDTASGKRTGGHGSTGR